MAANGNATLPFNDNDRSLEFWEPVAFDEFREQAIDLLRLGGAGVVGHENCFHRRGRDLTPLIYRVALLLRTDERDGTLENHEMWTIQPWPGATKPSDSRDSADRLLISHDEADHPGPPRFTGIRRGGHTMVVANDGRIFGKAGQLDAANMWRRGATPRAIAEAARRLRASDDDHSIEW